MYQCILVFCLATADPGDLIKQLGDQSPKVRARAAEKLLDLGSKALRPLEKAAASSLDAKVTKRCRQIVSQIYRRYLPEFKDTPRIICLPLKEFLQVGEKYRMQLEKETGKRARLLDAQPKAEADMTVLYLKDKVRGGAGRDEVQKIVKQMKQNLPVQAPLCIRPGFDKVRHLAPKKNPPWYIYKSSPWDADDDPKVKERKEKYGG
jgi:hypothetical protein